jgi:thiol-disulfide isomerase/thioredoxin
VRRWAGTALAALLVALLASGCGSSPGSARGSSADDTGGAFQSAGPQPAAALQPCPSGAGSVSRATAPAAERLPDHRFACLGPGPAVNLAALRGTPTLVNVWAHWCGPCRQEVPLLQRFHVAAGDRVRVLGVVLEDDAASALGFAADEGMTYPSVNDPDGDIKAAMRAPGPPVTMFVDAQGVVVFRQIGPFTSEAQLRALVQQHLGVSVA